MVRFGGSDLSTRLIIHEPGPASVLLGHFLINEAAVVLNAGEIATAAAAQGLIEPSLQVAIGSLD